MFARICVYMDLSKDLPEAVSLNWEDEEWIEQILDYEQLPFQCRIYHEYGHFGRNFPKGPQEKAAPEWEGEKQANEGFTQVKSRRRGKNSGGQRNRKESTEKYLESNNPFQILEREGEGMEEKEGRNNTQEV